MKKIMVFLIMILIVVYGCSNDEGWRSKAIEWIYEKPSNSDYSYTRFEENTQFLRENEKVFSSGDVEKYVDKSLKTEDILVGGSEGDKKDYFPMRKFFTETFSITYVDETKVSDERFKYVVGCINETGGSIRMSLFSNEKVEFDNSKKYEFTALPYLIGKLSDFSCGDLPEDVSEIKDMPGSILYAVACDYRVLE